MPKPLGFHKSGREIVSLIKVEVSNYFPGRSASSLNVLTSAAKLRKYHDASQSFLNNSVYDDKLIFPAKSGQRCTNKLRYNL